MNSLIGKAVCASAISDTGILSLTFDDGSSVAAPPDADYEARTVSGPHGHLIVSTPGGELVTFGPDEG